MQHFDFRNTSIFPTPSSALMSNFDGHREGTRPTLPPVRDLFREELSRSPLPPVSSLPLWRGSSTDPDLYRSSLRAGPRQDSCFDGHSLQPPSSHSQRDVRVAPYAGSISGSPGPENSPPPYHSHHRRTHPERASFDAIQRRPSHDQVAGSYIHYSQSPQPYHGSPLPAVAGTSAHHVPPYPDTRTQFQRRETFSGTGTQDVHYSSTPSTSPMKYECEYCKKGFTRPSSLKIHINSHTGEKPFVCTFEGCGRSFSVLSNMRRHARVHAELPGRQHDVSGDELSDKHSPTEH